MEIPKASLFKIQIEKFNNRYRVVMYRPVLPLRPFVGAPMYTQIIEELYTSRYKFFCDRFVRRYIGTRVKLEEEARVKLEEEASARENPVYSMEYP